VERLCREAVAALHGFAFAHVGIHGQDEAACRATAGILERLFNLPLREGPGSIFAGDRIELGKATGPGRNGHLGIRCNQVDRALAYFAAAGIQARPGTATGGPDRLQAVGLDLELGGFAVHLLQA